MNQIIERIVPRFFPGAVLVQFDESLQANVANACGHTAGDHRQAVAGLVLAFDSWIATDAFLARACRAAIIRLFIRTGFHALAIAPATFLINQHDTVFGTLIDGVSWTSSEAGGIGAMIADSRQIKKPRFVLG